MLNLKYKQKYLKYKNKYLNIKSQIGGAGLSYLWYVNHDDLKFSMFTIHENKFQNIVSSVYKKFLIDRKKIYEHSVVIEDENNIKYHGSKLLKVSFDYKYLNTGIKMFKLPYCMNFFEKYLYNFFNLPDIDLISVGSGNGLFEKCCEDVFGKEIICIDPEALSFVSTGLGKAFKEPAFKTVDEYLLSPTKKDNSILLLIWPDPSLIYDIDAILKLNPVSFFIIYGNYPLACSQDLRSSLYSDENDIRLTDKNYKKIAVTRGFGIFESPLESQTINIQMSVCINSAKINISDMLQLEKDKGYGAVVSTYPYLKRDFLNRALSSEMGEFDILSDMINLRNITHLEINNL
jgi:hypothetical protein